MIRRLALSALPAAGLASVCAAEAGMLRVNLSPSMPLGLYGIHAGGLRRGDTVLACLPEAAARIGRDRGYLVEGSCPGGAEVVIKRLVGLPGDQVLVTQAVVIVAGVLVGPGPRPADSSGRPLTPAAASHALADTVWLTSSDDGYDSRYAGPVPVSYVLGRATPLLTWGP